MTTTRGTRFPLHSQADKDAELARLDELAAHWSARAEAGKTKLAKFARSARARRRKVSGWVVGA